MIATLCAYYLSHPPIWAMPLFPPAFWNPYASSTPMRNSPWPVAPSQRLCLKACHSSSASSPFKSNLILAIGSSCGLNVRSQKWDLVVDVRGTGLSHFLLAKKRRIWGSSGAQDLRVHQLSKFMEMDQTPPSKIHVSSKHQQEAKKTSDIQKPCYMPFPYSQLG